MVFAPFSLRLIRFVHLADGLHGLHNFMVILHIYMPAFCLTLVIFTFFYPLIKLEAFLRVFVDVLHLFLFTSLCFMLFNEPFLI